MALDAVLLQRCGLAHVVDDVAEHVDELDLEHVLRLQLAHDQSLALVLDERRGGHPVQRLVAAGVVVDEDRAVVLQDQQPHGLGQNGVQATRVPDLTAGNEQAHRITVLSLSDRRSIGHGPGSDPES